jgi:hypothetical protein
MQFILRAPWKKKGYLRQKCDMLTSFLQFWVELTEITYTVPTEGGDADKILNFHIWWNFACSAMFRLPEGKKCQRSCRETRRLHRCLSRNSFPELLRNPSKFLTIQEFCLLGYNAVQSDGSQPTFRRNTTPLSACLFATCFLLGLFFNYKNIGDVLLRNVC